MKPKNRLGSIGRTACTEIGCDQRGNVSISDRRGVCVFDARTKYHNHVCFVRDVACKLRHRETIKTRNGLVSCGLLYVSIKFPDKRVVNERHAYIKQSFSIFWTLPAWRLPNCVIVLINVFKSPENNNLNVNYYCYIEWCSPVVDDSAPSGGLAELDPVLITSLVRVL